MALDQRALPRNGPAHNFDKAIDDSKGVSTVAWIQFKQSGLPPQRVDTNGVPHLEPASSPSTECRKTPSAPSSRLKSKKLTLTEQPSFERIAAPQWQFDAFCHNLLCGGGASFWKSNPEPDDWKSIRPRSISLGSFNIACEMG